MWSTLTEEIADGYIVRVYRQNVLLRFSEVSSSWQSDPQFRTLFNQLLADAPYAAFRWECPPITHLSVDRTFEFAIVDSPELESEADSSAFREHFKTTTEEVVSFPSLNRDSLLIAPYPIANSDVYAHIAAFVRNAPDSQKDALWRLVGKLMEEQVSAAPLWLSTAGAGVPWLHVRMDQRPKYYRHSGYRKTS
jgi:hypothetical protein